MSESWFSSSAQDEVGQPAEFDLLGTPWAEQLQSDRQAMAYLEVYNSIPGFLAHVTVDRLAQQTFNSLDKQKRAKAGKSGQKAGFNRH